MLRDLTVTRERVVACCKTRARCKRLEKKTDYDVGRGQPPVAVWMTETRKRGPELILRGRLLRLGAAMEYNLAGLDDAHDRAAA